MELFQFEFFRNALFAGVLVSIACAIVISITPLATNISLDGGFHLGFALTAVLISHFIWKNPGISVLIGVAAYAGAHIL